MARGRAWTTTSWAWGGSWRARQSNVLATQIGDSLNSNNASEAKMYGTQMLELLDDMDALLRSHKGFLLGNYIESIGQVLGG